MNSQLYVGYAQRKITPSLDTPVFLAGFDQNRRASSIHDDLWARTLVLACGETRAALAAVDVIGLARTHCLDILQRINKKWSLDNLIIAATHTHHGPDTIGLWGLDQSKSGVDLNYLNHLKKLVADCCNDALHVLTPVTLRTATANVPEVVQNFRNPEIVDDELTCLQFVDRLDKVFATLLIYPCHPESMWKDNTVITSDYADMLRRTVESATGAPALFCVGALGGMLSPNVPERSFDAAEAMGQRLGEAAIKALAHSAAAPVTALTLLRQEFTIPMRNPVFQMAIESGLLPNIVQPDGTVLTQANLLRLKREGGDVLLATVPGELLPKLGLALKSQLHNAGADTAAILGLANDELGYILPAEDFVFPENPFEPDAHYEETMSIGIDAGPTLMNELTKMIEQLK